MYDGFNATGPAATWGGGSSSCGGGYGICHNVNDLPNPCGNYIDHNWCGGNAAPWTHPYHAFHPHHWAHDGFYGPPPPPAPLGTTSPPPPPPSVGSVAY